MKAGVIAVAAALAGGAAAQPGKHVRRHAHEAFHERGLYLTAVTGTGSAPEPTCGCTTIYTTITGEGTSKSSFESHASKKRHNSRGDMLTFKFSHLPFPHVCRQYQHYCCSSNFDLRPSSYHLPFPSCPNSSCDNLPNPRCLHHPSHNSHSDRVDHRLRRNFN